LALLDEGLQAFVRIARDHELLEIERFDILQARARQVGIETGQVVKD